MTQQSALAQFKAEAIIVANKIDEEKDLRSPERFAREFKKFGADMRAIGKSLKALPAHEDGRTFDYAEKKSGLDYGKTPIFIFQDKGQGPGPFFESLVVSFQGTKEKPENEATLRYVAMEFTDSREIAFSNPKTLKGEEHIKAAEAPKAIAEWVGKVSPQSVGKIRAGGLA